MFGILDVLLKDLKTGDRPSLFREHCIYDRIPRIPHEYFEAVGSAYWPSNY